MVYEQKMGCGAAPGAINAENPVLIIIWLQKLIIRCCYGSCGYFEVGDGLKKVGELPRGAKCEI